jgi:manganese/zinc/iron transport system permease protein
MEAVWIIATGVGVAVLCGVLGCFLLLRKTTMIGDAISHAVLPGIAIAFIIGGTNASTYMLPIAVVFGLLSVWMIEYLHQKSKLQMDAAIGSIYTFLFAVGVILISLYSDSIYIDHESILYGEIAFVPFDFISILGFEIPRLLFIISIGLLIVLPILLMFYKSFELISFNVEYAQSIGIDVFKWNVILMAMLCLAVVLSFEAVGSILVLAFLVIPPATAFLLSKRLSQMLLYTLIFGISAVIGGYYLAAFINSSISACMALFAACIFALIFIRSLIVKQYV